MIEALVHVMNPFNSFVINISFFFPLFFHPPKRNQNKEINVDVGRHL